jgi:enoyl-CoA hydratase
MSDVTYEKRDRVAYVTLNRPERRNAINSAMAVELVETFMEIRSDEGVWVVIVTGAGDRAFCAGADLAPMSESADRLEGAPAASETAQSKATPGLDDLYRTILRTNKPMIVAVNGIALAGGAGIALSCDLRIMSERASMGWPHGSLGVSSISGPTLLAHLVPFNIALELEYYAEPISAERCLSLGIANAVVPHDRLMEEAEIAAARIQRSSPVSLSHIKAATIEGLDLPLDERLAVASKHYAETIRSEDAREGLRAFLEKRDADWSGR